MSVVLPVLPVPPEGSVDATNTACGAVVPRFVTGTLESVDAVDDDPPAVVTVTPVLLEPCSDVEVCGCDTVVVGFFGGSNCTLLILVKSMRRNGFAAVHASGPDTTCVNLTPERTIRPL
jgi:hypothetical protein